MVSLKYRNYCLNMQGYSALDDEAKERIDLAQRFKPAVGAALAIAAFVTQSLPLALIAVALGYWAAFFPYHPADVFYRLVLRRFGAPDLGADPTPRRFGFGMSASILLIGAAGLGFGLPVVGFLFLGIAAVALSALVFTDFCVGAFFYWLLVRRQIFRG